jgi:hypothetical protein
LWLVSIVSIETFCVMLGDNSSIWEWFSLLISGRLGDWVLLHNYSFI